MPVPTSNESDRRPPSNWRVHVEDALVLLALIPLFVLGVFYRRHAWAQAGLVLVLVVMAVVFVLRLRRVHRAFTDRDDEQ